MVLIMENEDNGSGPAHQHEADSPQNQNSVKRGVTVDTDIERTKLRRLRGMLNSLQHQASAEQRKYGKTFEATRTALRDARREWRAAFGNSRRD